MQSGHNNSIYFRRDVLRYDKEMIKMMHAKMIRTGIFLLLLVLLFAGAYALKDPSAVYCREMGYNYTINEIPEGQQGMCEMPDGGLIDAWRFLEGKEGQEYSYCAREGYAVKSIRDGRKCSSIYSADCTVCIMENGEEIEVTKLMNLSFKETICGDGFCGSRENSESCPEDCLKGFNWLYVIIPLAILIAAGIIFYLIKRRKASQPEA